MSIENLFPIAGNNAIQNVAFAIEWQAELSSSELQLIHTAIESELKHDFPIQLPQHHQKISFVSDTNSAHKITPSVELGGFLYEKRSQYSTNPTRSISLSKQSLIVLINEYSRWDNVWPDVNRYFSIILRQLKNAAIANIGLQYSDVFVWKDDPKQLRLQEVFKPNSKFLTPNVLLVDGLWHSHHGYIVELDNPVPNSRLDNVNVNLINDAGVLSIQITTSHRATLKNVIWSTSDQVMSIIDQVTNSLHTENKLVMTELLSDELCKKIKLEVNNV